MKKVLILILVVSIAVCAVEMTILSREPLTYWKAEWKFRKGEYEQARGLYAAVYFRDSAVKALECDYRLAEERFDRGDYSGAEALYNSAGDYKEAGQKALTCEYLTAADIKQDREAAEQILASYNGEQSVEELTSQYNYVLACLTYERNETEEAMFAFRKLGEYADSREWLERCQATIYDSAMASMLERDFTSAMGKFALAEPYGQSELYGKYCALRLDRDDIFDNRLILTDMNFCAYLGDGTLYYYEPVYIYVPNTLNTDTQFLIYFAGGNWDFYLDTQSAFLFCEKYRPNAVCIFRINSGIVEPESASKRMVAIAEQLAAECGLVIHEPTVVGTSNGAYVAMHTAVDFYLEDCVAVKNLLTLDTGFNWEWEEHLLSKEEREQTAALGIKFYLFEQKDSAPGIDAIWDLVYSGNDVTAVYGRTNDHDQITAHAFKDGVLSWALGETDQLDETYTLVPMKP